MTSMKPFSNRHIAIIGCGYLGTALARHSLAEGRVVVASTRNPNRAAALGDLGVVPVPLDLADLGAGHQLDRLLREPPEALFYLVPPGPRPALTLDEAPRQLVQILKMMPATRVVVASSTAVYGQCQGEWVTAETPAQASDDRGRALLAAEQLWSALPMARIVRLAGLYGPGRVIGQQDVSCGRKLPGSAERWLNLIEVSDAAALLAAVAASPNAQRIELGADGHPVTRGEYYQTLATLLNQAPPHFDGVVDAGPRGGRSASRRCDSRSTQRRTGWQPRYADYRAGLAAALVPAS